MDYIKKLLPVFGLTIIVSILLSALVIWFFYGLINTQNVILSNEQNIANQLGTNTANIKTVFDFLSQGRTASSTSQ